jgi:hypothetical protein
MVKIDNFDFQKSTRKNKKYMVEVNNKTIHFGDNRYQHYKDKIGLYSMLDHKDKERRRRYYARHGKADKHSAKWFSHKYLW